MNAYVTGAVIKRLREQRGMTQMQLAQRIGVSDKAVSKWETMKGLPDIALIRPLAEALGVSLMELMNGETVVNHNVAGNMLRTKLCVCPICGNIIHCTGEALVSCCAVTLMPLEAEEMDEEHMLRIEPVEDEHYLTVDHPMTKDHYISFVAFVTSDRVRLVKLYPEGGGEARLRLRGSGILYLYCNRHGLMKRKI